MAMETTATDPPGEVAAAGGGKEGALAAPEAASRTPLPREASVTGTGEITPSRSFGSKFN